MTLMFRQFSRLGSARRGALEPRNSKTGTRARPERKKDWNASQAEDPFQLCCRNSKRPTLMAGCGSLRCIPSRRGQLARWRVLAGFLERMMAQGDVGFAPMEEIAAPVRREIDEGRYLPRVDLLP